MEKYVIPRNVRVKESLIYGLNGKQVLYITVGLGGSLMIWTAGLSLPISLKIAGTAWCAMGGLALSMAKIKGQNADKFILNGIKFPVRQKEFGGENNEKAMVCNIRYVL